MDDMENRITAGELRGMGVTIPNSIPDCGHIVRDAAVWSVDPNQDTVINANGGITVPMIFTATEAFTWIEVNATITETK